MIDYSSWPRKKLLVKSLKLDNLNPRLSGFGKNIPGPSQILEYLIEHEDILKLSKDISVMGYLPNEEPIVYKEGKKYVVVEGNRRVTACKILVEPSLLHEKSPKFHVINRILNEFDNGIIKYLTVIIAPNREAADVLIVNRHTKGSSVEKWDKTKQDRFFYIRHSEGISIEELSKKFNLPKSAIRDSLTRFNVFEELLKLPLPEKDKVELQDETLFSMTNVERFYKSKRGKEFLGLDINNKGEIIHHLPKDEYTKRLTRITSDIVNNKLNSRTYGDDDLQKLYLSDLKKDNDFDFSILHSKSFEEEYSEKATLFGNEEDEEIAEAKIPIVNKVLTTFAAENKLIPPIAYNWKHKNVRIDRIFRELKEANLKDQYNSTVVLFRSYLDMVLYQFLNKNNLVIELIKAEQMKLDEENQKKLEKVKNYITSLKIPEGDIDENALKKALVIKSGVGYNWVPSLRQMLGFLANSNEFIPDIKLRQALIGYIKGNDAYLGHNDLNLLVHNEYFVKSKKELKETWDKLYPLLSFIING